MGTPGVRRSGESGVSGSTDVDMRGQETGALAAKATAGVGWLTVQTWLVRITGFVTVVILARLLTPSDFGLVAIAFAVLSLVYLMSDLGFATYLVQATHLDSRTVSTAFWYSVSAGAVLIAGMLLAAPFVEALFGVDDVAAVLIGMTPMVLCVSLASVPIAMLRRAMRFRAVALQSGIGAMLGQVAAIVFALAGAGVWALVIQSCVQQVVSVLLSWWALKWRPRVVFDWARFVEMVRFGTHVIGAQGASVVRSWGESAIISNVLGSAALGQLSIAQRLLSTVGDMMAAAVAPVSTVVFAQIRDDAARLRSAYDRAISMIYLVMPPILTAVAVVVPVFVPFLFGEQWATAVPVAQALAVASIFSLGSVLDHGFFYGMGRPGRWLAYAGTADILAIGVTAVLSVHGLAVVAIGAAVLAAAATCVRWVIVARLIGVHVWAVAKRTVAAVVAAAGAGLAGYGVMLLCEGFPTLVLLVLVGVTVMATHLAIAAWPLRVGIPDLRQAIVGRFVRQRREDGAGR